jgi:RNA polymerase sigma factor (sigma-70 family)
MQVNPRGLTTTSRFRAQPRSTVVSPKLAAQSPRSGPRASVAGPAGPPPFQCFLDAHREDVWRFLVASVGREDADDCFQETFIAALRAYPRLRVDSNLRAWVLTIAHRKALDVYRGRARWALPVAEIAAVADGAAGQAARGMPTRRRGNASGDGEGSSSVPARDETLWEAVHELPDRQRSAVVLRFVGDLPHRDIAAAIGCSEEAARRSLHEGLTTLRREVTT